MSSKEYNQRPEVKKKRKEYNQRPEVKERINKKRKENRQRPEIKEREKAYQKEYNQRPEVKKKHKEYQQRPEIKERAKETNKKYLKEYRQRPYVKENHREQSWKDLGIKNATVEKYNQILEQQNYSCAICGRHESEFKKRLHLDHDHSTGEIRGILCNRCNLILGDSYNIEIFKKVIEYLT